MYVLAHKCLRNTVPTPTQTILLAFFHCLTVAVIGFDYDFEYLWMHVLNVSVLEMKLKHGAQ